MSRRLPGRRTCLFWSASSLSPNLMLRIKQYLAAFVLFISVVVSSFFIEEQNMVNRPTVGATAAAFAGLVAAVASITNSLPLAQAFVAPSPAQQPTSARVPRRQSPVTTATTRTTMSMSYGSGEECPEIPTTPLLSKSFDVAVIALG